MSGQPEVTVDPSHGTAKPKRKAKDNPWYGLRRCTVRRQTRRQRQREGRAAIDLPCRRPRVFTALLMSNQDQIIDAVMARSFPEDAARGVDGVDAL